MLNKDSLSLFLGGDEDWRTVLTVPNILREFNPRLVGFSTGSDRSKSGVKGLNVAKNFAVSSELESQAEELISKIKRSSNVNVRYILEMQIKPPLNPQSGSHALF